MCFKSSEGIFSVAQLTTLGNFVKLHRAAVKGWNAKREKEMEQFQKVKIDKNFLPSLPLPTCPEISIGMLLFSSINLTI